MRSLLTFLCICLCLSVATAQTKKKTTTAKKATTTTKTSTTTAVKKPVVTKPRPATVAAVATEPAPSTLTFPSTEPENAATLDAVKKQQMYDELHGVKNQPNTPNTGKKGQGSTRNGGSMTGGFPTGTETKQADSEARTYIGVRVGGNYSTYLERLVIPTGTGGTIDVTPDPLYGFHAGIVFQFGRGGIAFQPEINFNQDYLKSTTGTISASSLVVPLLAKFQFGQQGNTRFFVNVGPYGTYALESGSTETVIRYGGALGLGVGIPAGPGKITVEARGYYPLGDSKGTYDFANIPGKPITGQVSLGYLFPLGSR
ncbi:porin family protein [Fibrella forsythiae]|uniref:PorT family protein n=1 Tax=Fibrella forsythiae TaxID=2817061 RepID=A0ABS3JL99_9BACT|nr:porin family protein [Fibrella forsythiae]MBO0950786.1 PorT family protein [Fibrella forsythiae]